MKKLLREDKTEKLDWTILPFEALTPVVRRFMEGAVKYERDNYKNCTPEQIFTYQQSMLRHHIQYQMGQEDEDHLAALAANVLIVLYNREKLSTPTTD